MNKIYVVDNKVVSKNLDENICLEIKNDTIFLTINNTTELEITHEITNETSTNMIFNIKDNAKLNLSVYKEGTTLIGNYIYNLSKNSILNLEKFSYIEQTNEKTTINLNEEKSTVNYIFKTISRKKHNYNLNVLHNMSNTTSNIQKSGINIDDGILTFDITGIVPKNKKGSILNQNNRIINLTNNKCTINPNLLIEEYDVIANHSALIGRFRDDELFYLQSRGITKNNAMNLLINGILLKDVKSAFLKEKITNITLQNWR